MYELILKHKFSAAHKLENYEGACANLHGHTWKIEIRIKTESLVNDMVIDFKKLKNAIDEKFDHRYINDQVSYNPTAERISEDIYKIVEDLLGFKPVQIKVRVWESDNASIGFTKTL